MTSSQPDWKPAKRYRANATEWAELRKLKLGPCRVCGRALGVSVTLHHLVGRDLGGDDMADNLVPLCGSGTMGCHGKVEHRDTLACMQLRSTLTENEILYVLARKNQGFLDSYYPR